MKTLEFKYNDKPRRIYEMTANETHRAGIDLSTMTKEQERDLTKLVDEFYENLKPFTEGHFRNFLRAKIQSQVLSSES